MALFTVSGNEITDLMRQSAIGWLANQQGGGMTDGLGYVKVTNFVPNGGAETNAAGFSNNQATTVGRDVTTAKFGAACFKATCNDNTRVVSDEWQQIGGGRIAVLPNTTYTFSLYVRDGGGYGKQGFLRVLCMDGGGALLATLNSANKAIPNNWQADGSDRFSLSFTTPANTASVRLTFQVTTNNNVNDVYYYDGVQLEFGLVLHDYVETNGASASAAVGTGDSSYGIMSSATNKHRYGQCNPADGTTGYGSTGGGVTTRANDATVPAPFSPNSMKHTTDGAAANQGSYHYSNAGENAVPGTLTAGAVWFKGVAGNSYLVQMGWNNTDASQTTALASAFVATGDWQLVIPAQDRMNATVAAGKTGDRAWVIISTNGTRAETFWTAHAMIEVLAAGGRTYVLPYVPTSAGAVATRNASRVSFAATQLTLKMMKPTQGYVAMRVRMIPSSNSVFGNRIFYGIDAGGTQRVSANIQPGSLQIQSQNGATQGGALNTIAFNAFDTILVILAWDAAWLYLSFNGSAFTKVARTQFPVADFATFDIGSATGTSNWTDGEVYWTLLGQGVPTDADAATLWALGNNDPTLTSISAGAGTRGMWDGKTNLFYTYMDSPVEAMTGAATMTAHPSVLFSSTQHIAAGVGTMTGKGVKYMNAHGNVNGVATMTGKPSVLFTSPLHNLNGASTLSDGGTVVYRQQSGPIVLSGEGTMTGHARQYSGETILLGVNTGDEAILTGAK